MTQTTTLQPMVEAEDDASLVVVLEADDEQRSTPPTVAFRLGITNTSNGPVTLTRNPYEGVTYMLADESGDLVELDAPTREAKVEGALSPRHERQSYLAVRGVHLGDGPLDVDDAIGRDEFEIDPGSVLTFELAVEAASDGDDGRRPLSAGTYELSVVVPVSYRSAGTDHQQVLSSDDVTVTVTDGS